MNTINPLHLKIVSTKEEAYAVASTSFKGAMLRILAALSIFFVIFGCLIYAAYITWFTNINISLSLICFIIIFIGWLIIPRFKNFHNSCQYNEIAVNDLKKTYQNKELLKQAWSKAKHWNKNEHILHQPREGYCGFAAMNSVLQSVCNQPNYCNPKTMKNTDINSSINIDNNFQCFIQFPKRARPMTYPELSQAWNQTLVPYLLKQGKNKDSNCCITDIKATPIDFTQLNLVHFEKIVRNSFDIYNCRAYDNNDNKNKENKNDTNTYTVEKRTYLIANFNRGPLWFSNKNFVRRFVGWLIGGHLTPIISYVEVDPSDDDKTKAQTTTTNQKEKAKEMHILIGDVNKKYGNYLLPAKRLFQAIKCLDKSGLTRGLIKIDVTYSSDQ